MKRTRKRGTKKTVFVLWINCLKAEKPKVRKKMAGGNEGGGERSQVDLY